MSLQGLTLSFSLIWIPLPHLRLFVSRYCDVQPRATSHPAQSSHTLRALTLLVYIASVQPPQLLRYKPPTSHHGGIRWTTVVFKYEHLSSNGLQSLESKCHSGYAQHDWRRRSRHSTPRPYQLLESRNTASMHKLRLPTRQLPDYVDDGSYHNPTSEANAAYLLVEHDFTPPRFRPRPDPSALLHWPLSRHLPLHYRRFLDCATVPHPSIRSGSCDYRPYVLHSRGLPCSPDERCLYDHDTQVALGRHPLQYYHRHPSVSIAPHS